MADMFLLTNSIDNIDFESFKLGIDELILIKEKKDIYDDFYKNKDSLCSINNYYEIYQDYTQENQFRGQYLEQLTPIDSDPKSIEELSTTFPEKVSGFIGIAFTQSNIDENYCVNNLEKFRQFKSFILSTVNSSNFSYLKNECFPNLIFCGDSEKQLTGYGSGKYFKQSVDQLIILENYLKNWDRGNFNYIDLKNKTSINISPESETTKNLYSNERKFSLQNGSSEIFDLHIKLGDIRIYILEDNLNKKLMIGYIGNHLSI